MQRFGWYRHKFVNSKVMERDPCEADRETLRKYKVYARSVRNSVERFEKTLGKLNPLHDDLKRNTMEFFCTSKQEDQVNRTSAIGDALLTIGASYDETRGEFVLLENRINQILNTIRAMEKEMKDRDFAYWERKHYEEKTEKMKANPKLLGTERMDNNLTKLANWQKKFEESDSKIVPELRGLNDERFDEMENLLKMYLVQLDKYYAGINKRMKEVTERELKVSASFKLTPLTQRVGDAALQQSMISQRSGASTMPSGVIKTQKGEESEEEKSEDPMVSKISAVREILSI